MDGWGGGQEGISYLLYETLLYIYMGVDVDIHEQIIRAILGCTKLHHVFSNVLIPHKGLSSGNTTLETLSMSDIPLCNLWPLHYIIRLHGGVMLYGAWCLLLYLLFFTGGSQNV